VKLIARKKQTAELPGSKENFQQLYQNFTQKTIYQLKITKSL
jgi:hypothetical protein